MKGVLSFFCTLIFSLLSVMLFSCSDSTPQVSTVQSTVVFDFADEKSSPSLRLSIFAETQGDVHRAGEIRLYHEESGMEWLCRSPQKIAGNDKKSWAGHRNFVSPGEASVPQGRYTLYYDDLFTGYYYVVFKAYIAFYRIDSGRVLVDRVLYGKSEYLRKLDLE